MEYGVQIFGCLPEFREDPAQFFQRLSKMGYRQIEPCVLFGDAGGVPGELQSRLWKPGEVPGFQRMMARYGLELTSCHVFCAAPLAAAEEMLQLAAETSIRTYVVNCPAGVAKQYPAFAQTCGQLAAALSAEGVSLWLHNGGEEIREKTVLDGRRVTVMEAVLALAGDRLGAQVDTGWVLSGGVDPAAFLKGLGARVRSVHFKDMAPGFEQLSGNDRFAVLGTGVTDMGSLFAEIPQSGVSVLVDQDASAGDFFADLEESLQALRQYRP